MVALIMLLFTDVHSNVFESFQENMDRHEKQDKTIRKLKKQLKFYMKKVGDFEGIHLCLIVCVKYILKIIVAQHRSCHYSHCVFTVFSKHSTNDRCLCNERSHESC